MILTLEILHGAAGRALRRDGHERVLDGYGPRVTQSQLLI